MEEREVYEVQAVASGAQSFIIGGIHAWIYEDGTIRLDDFDVILTTNIEQLDEIARRAKIFRDRCAVHKKE